MPKHIREKGSHTWDIFLYYHACPKCGKVFENRENYEYCLGKYQKELECCRCRYRFTETKMTRHTFGSLFE